MSTPTHVGTGPEPEDDKHLACMQAHHARALTHTKADVISQRVLVGPVCVSAFQS